MDIQLLETFLVVCEERNLSRAAVRLFRTQPAISRQIQALESLVGAGLLERSPRGVQLTAQGEELRARAARILGELRALKGIGSPSGELAGELDIACSDNVACHFLAPLLGRYAEECPQVRIRLVNGFTPGIANLVERGACELGFVLMPVRSRKLELAPVLDYHLVAVFPPRAQPKDGGAVAVKALCGMPLVLLSRETATRRSFDEMIAAKGCQADRVLEVGSIAVQKAMVRAGLGVGVLPGYALEPRDRLASLPIRGAKPRTLACCRLRDRPLSSPAQRFAALLQEQGGRRELPGKDSG